MTQELRNSVAPERRSRLAAAMRTIALALALACVLNCALPSAPAAQIRADDTESAREAEKADARRVPEAGSVEARMQAAREAAAVDRIDEAVSIYQDILREYPENERAFWGLVRVYTAAGMEDVLIPLLEERRAAKPRDPQTMLELGQAHARTGDHNRAHEVWTGYIELGPPDVGRYSDVGSMELRSRMFEQARETYLAGRAAFRSTSLFSQELTTIYTSLGEYGAALDECFVTAENHGGAVQWAVNRIERMLDEGAGRDDVRRRMDAVLGADYSPTESLSLAGSVYLVLGMPDRALESFLRADEVSGGTGEQLLEYGALLEGEGLVEEARQAFLMVVERHRGGASAARAGVAAARLRAAAGDPEGGVQELREVARAFEGSSVGAQALFESAKVQLDVLGDAEAALGTVAELRERFGQRVRSMRGEATLVEVDAYVRLGRFDEAHAAAAELTGNDVRDEVKESGLFALGFVSFLKHDYDRALEELRVMVEADAASPLVNDALRLMLIIATAQETGSLEPVDAFADARAAMLAGDPERARVLLERIAGPHVPPELETEALLALGADAAASREFDSALDYYDRIILGTEAITGLAEAKMRKGDILATQLDRPREAMDAYRSILEDLPPNLLSGEARRKLDRLRRGQEVTG